MRVSGKDCATAQTRPTPRARRLHGRRTTAIHQSYESSENGGDDGDEDEPTDHGEESESEDEEFRLVLESIQEDRSNRRYHQMLGRLRHEKKWEETRAKKKDAGSRKEKNKGVGHKRVVGHKRIAGHKRIGSAENASDLAENSKDSEKTVNNDGRVVTNEDSCVNTNEDYTGIEDT